MKVLEKNEIHIVVVGGTAVVTRGEAQFILGELPSTYISLGMMHRGSCPSSLSKCGLDRISAKTTCASPIYMRVPKCGGVACT